MSTLSMSLLFRSLRRRPEVSNEIYCARLSEDHGTDTQPAQPEPDTAAPAQAGAAKARGRARPGNREQAIAESNATLREQHRNRRFNLLGRSAGDTFKTAGQCVPKTKKTSPEETQ